MTRVCMIAYSKYASDGRIRREAEALAARGDRVDVVCLEEEGLRTLRELHGVRLYPVRVRRYQGSQTWRYLLSYAQFFRKAAFLVAVRHLRVRYAVVQVHTMPDLMVFAALLPRLMGAAVILDVHDLMPELFMSKFRVGRDHPIIRTITRMETASVAFAHRAIAVHDTHLEALVSHGNPRAKFEVVLNAADPAIFTTRWKQPAERSPFKLVYHGTISERHGLELAIRAVAAAQKEIKDLKLSIIGDGDDRKRLIDLVEELRLQDKVEFREGVPVDQLPALLEDADLGIVPLHVDVFTQYMLPAKLLEYVALGIPSIVTRTKTTERYFDDKMVEYISGESEVELAQKIIELHNDPERRTQMQASARLFTIRNAWELQKMRYFHVIDSLVAQGGRTPGIKEDSEPAQPVGRQAEG